MDYFGKKCFTNADVEKWQYNRPRMGTLEDALDFDKKTINQLLNRGDEAAKCAIGRIVDAIFFEYAESNRVNNDFYKFAETFYGEKKFNACMKAWLTSVGNSFWERAGMPQEQQPISTLLMFPNDEDDE